MSLGNAVGATVGAVAALDRSAGGVGTTNPAPSPQAASETDSRSAAPPRTAGAAVRRRDCLASEARPDTVLRSDRTEGASAPVKGSADDPRGDGVGLGVPVRRRAVSVVPRLACMRIREPRADRDSGRREPPTIEGTDPFRPRPDAPMPRRRVVPERAMETTGLRGCPMCPSYRITPWIPMVGTWCRRRLTGRWLWSERSGSGAGHRVASCNAPRV